MEALILNETYFDKELVDADEELHDIETKQKNLILQAKRFLENDEWKAILVNIKSNRVLKMNQIIQSLLFLNGVEREEVCAPNSNALSWKKAKEWLTEKLPELMAKYEIFGEKKGDFKKYQTINYCEKIIGGFTQEEVDTYNPGLGRLFKWNKAAIDGRKTDITRRMAL
jgi:hypothetical protein